MLALGSVLAVSAFIFFDVLDLDGSDLQNRLLPNTQAQWTPCAEAEQPLRQWAAGVDRQVHDAVAIVIQEFLAHHNPFPCAISACLPPELNPLRAGAHVARDALSPSSQTGDPPQTLSFPV